MNIQTATLYAKQGYHICREYWNGSIYIIQDKYGEIFVWGDAANQQYFSFSVEDLLADDWKIKK